MHDQNKVLDALKNHCSCEKCTSCPYFNTDRCRDALIRDVYLLFKAIFKEELSDE